jgi:hypothetical protein
VSETTDRAAIVARFRKEAAEYGPNPYPRSIGIDLRIAADLLEADAARIAEKDAEIARLNALVQRANSWRCLESGEHCSDLDWDKKVRSLLNQEEKK